MTTFHKPTLASLRHDSPYLLDYAFDMRDGNKLHLDRVEQMIDEYFSRHIRGIMVRKGLSSETALELLLKEIRAGHVGKGMYGNIADHAKELQQSKYVRIESKFESMATLGLRRFGECLGIKPVDNRGNRHELGTELLDGMVRSEDTGGFRTFHPFVHAWYITMPRWQAYGGGLIDVAAELASATRYVPDVEWYTDATLITERLLDRYIQSSGMCGVDVGGVEVGQYHGITVRMQVLFGDEKRDQIWRQGAISRNGAKLFFDNRLSDSAHIRYSVRTTDENNMFNEPAAGIDYMQEQQCLKYLAEILLNAFTARDLAETIVTNPHWVAWKLKEQQVEAVTV